MIITIEGEDRLEAILAKIPAETRNAAASELQVLLAWLQNSAMNLCPVKEGTLKGSADSDAQVVGDNIEGFVSFDTEYATRQHEEMSYHHAAGTQAKYLQQPYEENIDSYIEALGRYIGEAVDKP